MDITLMNTKVAKKIILISTVYITLGIFFTKTNPQNLSLPLLIVPFFVIFLGLYIPIKALATLYSRNLPLSSRPKHQNNRLIPLSFSLFITFLLVLSSINQLSLKDVILGGVLVIGLMFYIKHFRLA